MKSDLTAAMKAGEKGRVSALRLVVDSLQQAAKVGDSDEFATLRRELKRRREAETAYREAGRAELADQEAFEAEMIEGYLPAGLSDEELDSLIQRAITETGAQSPRDMGGVIKFVMTESQGRADGKQVSTKVKELLT